MRGLKAGDALSAITSLCPQIDADSLVLDVTAGPREADDVLAGSASGEIWISEMTPGGNGQIEEAQRQYVEDPRRFFSLMTAAIRDNDFSLSDFQLSRFLTTVVEGDRDDPLPAATLRFRPPGLHIGWYRPIYCRSRRWRKISASAQML